MWVAPQDSLVQRHFASRVDARLPLLEYIRKNGKIFIASGVQEIIEEALLIEQNVNVVLVVSEQYPRRFNIGQLACQV